MRNSLFKKSFVVQKFRPNLEIGECSSFFETIEQIYFKGT